MAILGSSLCPIARKEQQSDLLLVVPQLTFLVLPEKNKSCLVYVSSFPEKKQKRLFRFAEVLTGCCYSLAQLCKGQLGLSQENTNCSCLPKRTNYAKGMFLLFQKRSKSVWFRFAQVGCYYSLAQICKRRLGNLNPRSGPRGSGGLPPENINRRCLIIPVIFIPNAINRC
jgi:hypothetical protein